MHPDFLSNLGPETLAGFDLEKFEIPEGPEHADENLKRLAGTSRRSFLGRSSAVAAGALGAAGVLGSTPPAGAADAIPSLYPGSTRRSFQELQVDEATHVNILVAAIRSLGGTPRPLPTFANIRNLGPTRFLNTAVALENTGVGAYFGALPYVQDPNVLGVLASIALVEAYHSGFLNYTSNAKYLIPNGLTYAVPLTLEQVTKAATPLLVSLNDDGKFPATYSTTPSAANDLAILNLALLLEYLEASFYFYNVNRIFG